MVAELISVGTELLMGQIVNTDAQYLAQQLSKYGIDLYHQSVVGDNMNRLVEAIGVAMKRCDLLILSGGLGPTADDLTKEAVAQYLGRKMIRDEPSWKAIEAYFERSGRVPTPNNFKQAEFPEGAVIFPNSCGTAPGCICEKDGGMIAVLPGPPHELKAMFELSLAPWLEAHMDKKLYSRVLRIFGKGESSVEYELRDMIDGQKNPTIAPYAAIGEVTLRVTAACKPDEDPEQLVEPVIGEICRRLGDVVYSTGGETLPQLVARLMAEGGKTLALAESLTGGMVASDLVEIPGMSRILMEGVVAYTDAAKVRLGVRKETLERYGSVSEQTAREMAEAIRCRAGSDYGLSTTGVAGPGPDEKGNPAGLVYVGIADETGSRAVCVRIGGHRQRVRISAVLRALDVLRRALTGCKALQ